MLREPVPGGSGANHKLSITSSCDLTRELYAQLVNPSPELTNSDGCGIPRSFRKGRSLTHEFRDALDKEIGELLVAERICLLHQMVSNARRGPARIGSEE